MTEEDARVRLLSTGFCSDAMVKKYLQAARYIQSNGWEYFESSYDFAPHEYIMPKTGPIVKRRIERQHLEESHTLKLDFRQHLHLAGVKVEEIKFSDTRS